MLSPSLSNARGMQRLWHLTHHVCPTTVASTSPEAAVLYSVTQSGVATIQMNEPHTANTFTPSLTEALSTAIAEAEADPQVRVVILTGTGRVFSAGGNAVGMSSGGGSAKAQATRPKRAAVARHALMESSIQSTAAATTVRLREMPKPTIAVLNGGVGGGGLSWACACDIRLAAASAKLATGFINVGLSIDYGASYLLPQLVGQSMARELFFTGRKIDAEEAQRIGLVSRVLPDAELMASAMELAEEMAAKAPTALASMKRNLNDNVDNDLEDSIKVEAMRIGPLLGGAENKEAASAFLQKRPPNFD